MLSFIANKSTCLVYDPQLFDQTSRQINRVWTKFFTLHNVNWILFEQLKVLIKKPEFPRNETNCLYATLIESCYTYSCWSFNLFECLAKFGLVQNTLPCYIIPSLLFHLWMKKTTFCVIHSVFVQNHQLYTMYLVLIYYMANL